MTSRIRREFEELYGSHTPESYRTRLWTWFQENYTDEFGAPPANRQPRRTPEELAARRIGDAERIACTLLTKTEVEHPIAREWIRRIVADPAFAVRLDEFAREQAGLSAYDTDGYATADVWDAIVDMRAHPEDAPALIRRIDRAAILLATDVVEHRLYHEPDTDHTLTVQGLYTVTTSLAARVVEFHQAVADAYAADARRRGR